MATDTRYLTPEQAAEWQRIADLLKTAYELASEAHVSILLKTDRLPESGMERITAAVEALAGLAYLCTPQGEWMGNNLDGEPIFKTRRPHIYSMARREPS